MCVRVLKRALWCLTDFGTISLNNSIFNLPAGVSPMLISMNTIGRVEEDIICEERRRDDRLVTFRIVVTGCRFNNRQYLVLILMYVTGARAQRVCISTLS